MTDEGGRVAGLLLAAGGGRRPGGRPKALLPHRGRLLVEHAAEALRAGGCASVHVVLGARAEEVRARVALPGCVLVDDPDREQGMGTSLRAGLDPPAGTDARAALVLLVDQPGIGPEAVARVRRAYRSPHSPASAAYDGARGHPVLSGRRALGGDRRDRHRRPRGPRLSQGARGRRGTGRVR